MKVFTVVGARPQFVKAAVVSRIIAQTKGMEEILVHTGQHFDANMSDIFFEEMQIPTPDYNLEINSVGHGAMTGRMLEQLEKLMLETNPTVVLIYGDTNSTLAGALAAKKLQIPVAHVEAGLRSFDMSMPEEVNRILSDRISTVLFCPTEKAIENLKNEGYSKFNINIVKSGDVMEDAAKFYAQTSAKKSTIIKELSISNFVLCTLHRAENTDNRLKLSTIIEALNEINKTSPVILPLHPRTKKYIEKYGLETEFKTIAPVGYFDMIELLKHSSLVLTDSGGLQKEAYFFHSNCVTIRDHTEWVELVNEGFNTLADATNKNDIVSKVKSMLLKHSDFSKSLYGSGKAGQFIVDYLKKLF